MIFSFIISRIQIVTLSQYALEKQCFVRTGTHSFTPRQMHNSYGLMRIEGINELSGKFVIQRLLLQRIITG